MVEPTRDESWILQDAGFALAREHEVESVFAVGNGLLGVRGSVPEGTSLSDPATFVSGVFDVEPHWNGIPGLMVLADWTNLTVVIHGQALTLETGEILEHRRLLDMKQGLLWREWLHRDEHGRITRLYMVRLASLADRHLGVQRVVVTAENYAGRLGFESRIGIAPVRTRRWDSVSAERPRPSVRLLPPADQSDAVISFLQSTTGRRTVAFATAAVVTAADGTTVGRSERCADADVLAECWECESRAGGPMSAERVVAVDRTPEGANGAGAADHARSALAMGTSTLIADHVRCWDARWLASDITVDGDPEAQRALRFAIYHLISAANPDDPHVSIGARALTGEAYRGHVFWDTEIYLLPFFTYTFPAAARSLLRYRHITLPGARRKAQAMGYRGALYAWESTDTGDETTPTTAVTPGGDIVRILTGEEEHHISADVAFAVWQYWQITEDDEFFVHYGAEILIETARFWASRGTIEADGSYHIRRVIGPDEYHETIDDNAYTNVMARWNLERGAETAHLLRERWPEAWSSLATRIGLDSQEPARWLEVASSMKTGFDRRTSLFEQFEGYFDLEDIPLASFEPRNAPIDILLQRERLQGSRIVKQADVVALAALLWDDFPRHVHEANFRYYEPRTAHGSSLSPAMHAMVAARLGDDGLFDRFFRQAAQIDLANNMGNAAGGIHVAALGGLWQAAVLGVGGLRTRPDGLAIDPHLPRTWAGLHFAVQWRGRTLGVALDRAERSVRVRMDGPAPMMVSLDRGEPLTIEPGSQWLASQQPNGTWTGWGKDVRHER